MVGVIGKTTFEFAMMIMITNILYRNQVLYTLHYSLQSCHSSPELRMYNCICNMYTTYSNNAISEFQSLGPQQQTQKGNFETPHYKHLGSG